MTATQSRFFANFLQLNLAMLCISTSGVLGRYIDLPIPITIGLRALLASLILFSFCKWKKLDFNIQQKDLKTVIISGLLLGIHWITYFYALKLSNVAIGMLSLFTYPVLTAILEPIIRKTKILKFHLFLGCLVLIGIYFLVPDFDVASNTLQAVGFGTLSAVSYSFRNIFMAEKVKRYNGIVLMTYQLFVIAIALSPFFFIMDGTGLVTYLPATLALALITTSIGHTLFLYSFKHFSTATASIISCTQPIYGILLGMLLLQEYPEPSTLIGGTIIIITVFAESFRVYKQSKSTV